MSDARKAKDDRDLARTYANGIGVHGLNMTLAEIQAQKYIAAILVADVAEARIRMGDIEPPYWFLDAWRAARKELKRIQERAR